MNKRSLISGKTGEIIADVPSDIIPDIESLNKDEGLIKLIANEMARKTKQAIISLDITDIKKL